MSSEEPEKLEAGDAGGEEAKKIARAAVESAEAEKVLTERRIDEAIFDHLKSNKDVRVVDLSKKLGTVDKAVIAARLEKLVEEGDLGAGNTSSAPNFKRYPPDGKKKKIIEFVGDEPKDEKTVKDFVKTLDLPNKEARRDFLDKLVTKKILNFENGKYSKFQAPKNDAENSDVAAQPAVEVAKDSSPTMLDEKTIEHLRPVVGKIQDTRSAMIRMMNQVEGGRRVATQEEKDAFYGNLRIFLETARSAESSGLRLSAQREEQKKFLEDIDALTEKRLEDKDEVPFRRAVIGIGDELATKLKFQERRVERERTAAATPEPLPDLQTSTPEIAKKLSPEEIRARGKNLEQAREAMVQMMATINHPTAEQQKELREELGIFLKSTNELQESGLLLSAEALKDKTLLERSVINKIFNPRKFRTALQRIDDEFLAQAPVVEKENKKSNEVIERPLISSEKFSDDKYHRFGDFEKKQFVGVYMGHDGDNQDAFAVNEKSVAVGDGMGSYHLSGLLSRHVVERMAARVKKPASYEEFQKLFEDGSLGALLTVINDDKHYQQARQDFIAQWNTDKHPDFSFDKLHKNGETEGATTFSVIRESDDGAEMQYAVLGDSPIIVVDRDETGAVTSWQLLNEKGIITDLEGKNTQVDITDKTAYDPSIIRELRSNSSDGIGLTADGIAMYGAKAVTGRIPKKENRLVIVASDGLTKLLTKSPLALENQAVFCDQLLNFSDEQFAQYVKDTKDSRFPLAVSADGTPNPDEIKRAKAIIKADYTTLFDQAYAVQKTYPQLWNIDGSLNMLAVLSADPETLEFAGDDLTYIVAAAGEQKVSLPLQAVVQPKTITEEPVEALDAIKPTVVSKAEIESMPVRKYTDADYTEEEIKKGKEFVDSILERSEAKVPERLLTKDQLEEPMMLRARALMVLEIVNMLPGENPALREQIAEALVSRVAREIVEGYDKNSYIPGDQLRNLLPLLRERLVNDQDLLNDLGPKLQTWRQLAQRLSSGMNEVGAAMYKAWVAQYPERKNQFFDYERNTLYDLVLAADQWIADLKNNTTLDSNLKRLLLVNLEQAKRNAEQKFEIWGKEKLERITKVEEVETKPEKLTDTEINALISKQFREKLHAPLSTALPENPAAKTDPYGVEYEKILANYSTTWKETDAYDLLHPGNKKTDFIDQKDANISWKFHLNVLQENVVAVSEYLKTNGYVHKYLHGGEPEDGKIFTIYIGSYGLAAKLAQKIATDLDGKLAKPLAHGEIELAPGIVGRFSGGRGTSDKDGGFHQYGVSGFTLLKPDLDRIWGRLHWGKDKAILIEYYDLMQAGETQKIEELLKRDTTGAVSSYVEEIKSAEVYAFKVLRSKYGDYFFPVTPEMVDEAVQSAATEEVPEPTPATTSTPSPTTSTPPAKPGSVTPPPLDTPPTPKIPAKKKPATSAKPLDIKFEGGRFNVLMAEAFRNDVFYNFFQKFDTARNPGARFDATLPGHDERYEKGLEAYMLWREAIQVFKLHAAERLERDLGLKPYPEDLTSIESDLERLIVVDTQRVRGLIDQIKAYAGMEEDEARKENELIDLGGFAKVQSQVDELDVLRREKKARANEYIAALSVLSRQRADAARAFEVKKRAWFQWPKAPKKEKAGDQAIRVISGVGDNVNRATSSFFGSIMDRLRGAIAPTRSSEASRSVRSLSAPESVSQLEATGRALDKFITAVEDEKRTSFFGSMVNSAKERFRGLLRGKEAVDLERKLQSTYGMSVDEAADSYPEMYKRERAFELQTEAAIREYEKIEQRYFEVKDQILASKLPRVTQEKEQISTQFDQLRRAIIADTGIATTVAKLTAGRSIDIIKGLMDPESITPNRAKKAEEQLAGLRRAADFDFTEGRYAGVPELAPLVGEGELITEADTVINEGVKGELKDAVAKFKKIDKKGIESISKTFASYGQRGYELGEQVLGEAIVTARAANDDRRANIFQVLLLEIRALKS